MCTCYFLKVRKRSETKEGITRVDTPATAKVFMRSRFAQKQKETEGEKKTNTVGSFFFVHTLERTYVHAGPRKRKKKLKHNININKH